MIEQNYTILNAIVDLGGINPDRIKKAGMWAEWSELPRQIRSRIFRHKSTQSADEIAAHLREFGVQDERDLLEYLTTPAKVELTDLQATDYDRLVRELAEARKEIEQLENSRPYRLEFIQCGNRYIPVRIPIIDTPF